MTEKKHVILIYAISYEDVKNANFQKHHLT